MLKEVGGILIGNVFMVTLLLHTMHLQFESFSEEAEVSFRLWEESWGINTALQSAKLVIKGLEERGQKELIKAHDLNNNEQEQRRHFLNAVNNFGLAQAYKKIVNDYEYKANKR